MTEDNKDMNFGIPQSYPNQSVRTILRTSSGAGVNADSRIDTTFVECRTENIPPCPWDAGPSNMVRSPTHSMRSRGASDDKSIGDRKVTKLQVELTVNSEAALGTYLTNDSRSEAGPLFGTSRAHHSGTTDDMAEVNPVEEKCAVHLNEKQECNYEEQALCCRNDVQFEDVATTSKTDTGFPAGRRSKNSVDALPLLANKTEHVSSSCRIEDVTSGNQTLGLKAHGSENAPIEGLESSAENDVHNAFGQSEKGSRVESSYPVEVFGTPVQKINLLQGKGKKITLFGKDINENLSKSKDDSHDSVESSNSATLSSKGKKRGSFEQQLVVGSKRIKSLPQEASSSTSIKPNSSFINWISNMVKGLPKAKQDECPPALRLNHPDHRLDCYDQQNQACNEIQDPGSGHMGFQSIFRSLYCPKTIVSEGRPNDNPTVSGAKKFIEVEKSFINVMPISFCRENDVSCKKLLMDNDLKHHTSGGNGGDLSIQNSSNPRILCANNDSTEETRKTKSIEIKLSRPTCSKEQDGIRSPHTWLDDQKIVSLEYKPSHILSEGQVMPYICNKNDPSRSLWISRFSSRNPSHALDLDHSGRTQIKLEDSSERRKHNPQNHVDSFFNLKNSETAESYAEDPVNAVVKDKYKCATDLEASIGFNRVVGHNHGKPLCGLKSSPPTFTSLEPMTSAFARRLEVLKSIPSVSQDDPTPIRITCLYCGKSGHNLVSCSDVQKTELVDLMRNSSSHDAAKGSGYWCIQCLQLGHLAISCPVASSSRQQQSYKNASIHNYRTADRAQLHKNGEPYSSMLLTKESNCKVPSDHSSSSGKVCKILGSDKRVSCLDDVQNRNHSRYKELEVKDNQVPPLCKSVSNPIPDDALNIFEAVRKLRLSRMDILKWMNSHISLVHLNGYFLRLRLRKWETELGGTGYYVACINESQREMMSKGSERSIFVTVGDIRCSVESQYISNNDFSEDELMAWWDAISKTGEMPTLDNLRSKFEEKPKLGL